MENKSFAYEWLPHSLIKYRRCAQVTTLELLPAWLNEVLKINYLKVCFKHARTTINVFQNQFIRSVHFGGYCYFITPDTAKIFFTSFSGLFLLARSELLITKVT